ncbi:MAG TPA: TlpA disulfide reductase family protein [Vicinamibacteria bacterium]|nr:TlpA disulfide reductase family protein [Vicinamibacteria bacterium]
MVPRLEMKSALRTVTVVLVVVAAAFAYVHLAENRGYALKAGSAAPPFRLPSLAGGALDLGSQRGKIVVLNFWATWCPPCVAEMPSLERLHRTLSPEGLAVVTVSTDEDEAELRRFVTERALTLPVLKDPGGRTAADLYRTTGYPETFVLDRAGRLLEHVVGPAEWDSAARLAGLRRLLKDDSHR